LQTGLNIQNFETLNPIYRFRKFKIQIYKYQIFKIQIHQKSLSGIES